MTDGATLGTLRFETAIIERYKRRESSVEEALGRDVPRRHLGPRLEGRRAARSPCGESGQTNLRQNLLAARSQAVFKKAVQELTLERGSPLLTEPLGPPVGTLPTQTHEGRALPKRDRRRGLGMFLLEVLCNACPALTQRLRLFIPVKESPRACVPPQLHLKARENA